MKKIIFIIICLVVIVYSLFKVSPSFSSGSVLYFNGNAKSFTYYNINKKDVFNEFKDLIPGDVRSQNLTIRVGNIRPNTKLYLKLNSDINDDILKYINIKVYEGDNLLSANEDMIMLYTFDKDTVINLKVVVDVPLEVDNVISDVSSSMKWSFMVEEDGEMVESPLTYDGFNMRLYVSLIIVSLVMIVILLFGFRKRDVIVN